MLILQSTESREIPARADRSKDDTGHLPGPCLVLNNRLSLNEDGGHSQTSEQVRVHTRAHGSTGCGGGRGRGRAGGRVAAGGAGAGTGAGGLRSVGGLSGDDVSRRARGPGEGGTADRGGDGAAAGVGEGGVAAAGDLAGLVVGVKLGVVELLDAVDLAEGAAAVFELVAESLLHVVEL